VDRLDYWGLPEFTTLVPVRGLAGHPTRPRDRASPGDIAHAARKALRGRPSPPAVRATRGGAAGTRDGHSQGRTWLRLFHPGDVGEQVHLQLGR
jgi:hypothetical protein